MAIINFNSISGVSTISVASSITVGNNVLISGDRVTATTFSGNVNSTSGVTTVTTLNATSIVGVTTAGITTVYTTTINGGPISGARNMIINGSQVINQRGFTGASGTTTSNSYITDRFKMNFSHDGAVSAGQTSMNSTVGGSAYADGFQNALFFKVTTADASLSASQYQLMQQRIEGYNVQGIKKGTANAQPITLSFWVRSTTIGTYIVDLGDDDNTREVSQAYTINAANTWEKKILTFPADTTGVFNNDNDASLDVIWWLAAGSDYTSGTLQTTWGARVNANRAVGQTNLLATVGNDFFLTGIQLEVGPQATEFERRSYGQELALCQRYYWQINGSSGNQTAYNSNWYNTKCRIGLTVPTPMRNSPTISLTGSTAGAFFTTNDDSTYINFAYVGAYGEINSTGHTSVSLSLTPSAAGPGGGLLYIQTSRVLSVSAEL